MFVYDKIWIFGYKISIVENHCEAHSGSQRFTGEEVSFPVSQHSTGALRPTTMQPCNFSLTAMALYGSNGQANAAAEYH